MLDDPGSWARSGLNFSPPPPQDVITECKCIDCANSRNTYTHNTKSVTTDLDKYASTITDSLHLSQNRELFLFACFLSFFVVFVCLLLNIEERQLLSEVPPAVKSNEALSAVDFTYLCFGHLRALLYFAFCYLSSCILS